MELKYCYVLKNAVCITDHCNKEQASAYLSVSRHLFYGQKCSHFQMSLVAILQVNLAVVQQTLILCIGDVSKNKM